jgi:glycosyltransferase involved in cell wall biosynthesis
MNRILFIDDSLENNDQGFAVFIRNNFIVRGLKELNYDIYRGSYNDTYSNPSISDDFKYILHKKPKLVIAKIVKQLMIDPIYLFVFIIRQKFDIFICNRVIWNLTPCLIIYRLFCKKKFVIIINEFQNINSSDSLVKQSIAFYLESLLLKRATHIIVISDEHKKYYSRYNKNAKFIIIPMLIDIGHKPTIQRNNQVLNVFNICYAGTLDKSNGIELLLSSISHIKAEKPFFIHLFGPVISSYATYLKNIIAENRLNNVLIYPPKNNKDTIEFLSQCDLLIIPKIVDQRSIGYIPSKLGDYLYSGVPVLVTNVGIINKYIIDGFNGFLCEPECYDMANKISYIMENIEKMTHVGVEGKKTAKKFDYIYQCKIILQELLSD